MQDIKEPFDARQHCRTTQFRPDLNDLCESCGLREIIRDGMENQIISQALQQKEILTAGQFDVYCKGERESAQQAMMKANHLIGRDKTSQTFAVSYPGVTHHHIWNKERIKALNRLQSLKPADTVISDERQNAFNAMPLDEVKRWFTQLAETNSKDGSPFLTVEQVEQFIERAFCGEKFTEKLSINEQIGDKGNVIGLFHKYYHDCATQHRTGKGKIDPSATAKKYVKLLTDHFDNWTLEQVENNFRSGGNWKNKP